MTDIGGDFITSSVVDNFISKTYEYSTVKVFQCKIEVADSIHRCGMFSHSSIVSDSYAISFSSITRSVSDDLWYGTFQIRNTIIKALSLNSRQLVPLPLLEK